MSLKVAVVQASPHHLDLEASLHKTLRLVEQAAALGARLVAFPETWLSGYPAWLDCCRDVALWDHEPMKRLFARLRANSVVVPGPVTERWPPRRASINWCSTSAYTSGSRKAPAAAPSTTRC